MGLYLRKSWVPIAEAREKCPYSECVFEVLQSPAFSIAGSRLWWVRRDPCMRCLTSMLFQHYNLASLDKSLYKCSSIWNLAKGVGRSFDGATFPLPTPSDDRYGESYDRIFGRKE